MNFNRGKMAAAAVLAATLLVVGGVEVPRRDDDVGINIVAVFMNGSMCFHW